MKPMRCKDYLQMLSAYQDGELKEQQAEDIRRHLEVCKDCQQELEALNQLQGRLNRLEETEPGESFTAQVMGRLKKRKSRWLQLLPTPLQAMVFMVFFIMGIMINGYQTQTDPTPQVEYLASILAEGQNTGMITLQDQMVDFLDKEASHGN